MGTGEGVLASGVGCVGVEITLPELFGGGAGLDNVSTSRRPFREILASHTTSTPTATRVQETNNNSPADSVLILARLTSIRS